MSIPMALTVLVLLLVGNAFFVAAEFAMVTARRDQIEPRAAAGSGAAKWALKGIEDVSASLAATQLGITACSLLIGAVGEPAVAALIEMPMHALGVPSVLQHPIALAIVEEPVEEGTAVAVDVRGRTFPMTVANLPFYKRTKP